MLAVPLMREGGALRRASSVARHEPGLFAPDQVALVQTFARQAAIAIDNVRLFNADQGSARAADRDQRDPARDLGLADRRAAGARRDRRAGAAGCATPPVGVDRCWSKATASASPAGYEGTSPMPSARSRRCRSAGDSIVGRAMLERRTFTSRTWRPRASRVLRGAADRDSASGHRTTLAVPLMREGQAFGAIAAVAAGGAPVQRAADRAGADVRRPGGDRHRERPPVQRDQGSARPAARVRRSAAPRSRARSPTRRRCSTRFSRAASACSRASVAADQPRRRRRTGSPGGLSRPWPTTPWRASFPFPLDAATSATGACDLARARCCTIPTSTSTTTVPPLARKGWQSAWACAPSIVAPMLWEGKGIGTDLRRPRSAGRVFRQGHRAPAHVRRPGGDRDPERAAGERDPATRAGARGRQQAQVGVPRLDVARAAHAAQRDHRLFRSAARAPVRRAQREAGRLPQGHPLLRAGTCSTSSTTCSTCRRSRRAGWSSSRRSSTCPRRWPMR